MSPRPACPAGSAASPPSITSRTLASGTFDDWATTTRSPLARRRSASAGGTDGTASAGPGRASRTPSLALTTGGCFAVEDGDLPDNGLIDKPVLFCRGQFDDVIPRHKFEPESGRAAGGEAGGKCV